MIRQLSYAWIVYTVHPRRVREGDDEDTSCTCTPPTISAEVRSSADALQRCLHKICCLICFFSMCLQADALPVGLLLQLLIKC
jgi:hypothetical protein